MPLDQRKSWKPVARHRGHAAWTGLLVVAASPLAFAMALAAGQAGGKEERRGAPPAGAPARGDEKDETRRDFDMDCLRSGCHSSLAKATFVHAPVAVGACASCHEAEGDVSAHRFRYVRAEKDLCSFCHPSKTPMKFLHTAYAEGQCSGCHDPHGGRDRLYLRNENRSALCLECHDASLAPAHGPGEEKTPFAFLHRPVAEKRCAECHASHGSDHAALLPLPERDLCLVCHAGVLTDLGSSAHVHQPLETGCSSCHAGHGGADPGLLRAPSRELCLGCHESVLAAGREGRDAHPPLRDGATCLACHEAHVSDHPGLVVGDVGEACYTCHGSEIILEGGRKVADVKAEVAAASFVHEPVLKGDCSACHAGHTSKHGDLLAKPYTLGMYAEVPDRAFELCFDCHDRALVTADRTTATRFRDGDRNLHHVHVDRKKSRTCALCHQPHASAHPALMREEVPFGPGAWPLAIGFRRTETGGACASGCHQELVYRNVEPAGAGADRVGDPEPIGSRGRP